MWLEGSLAWLSEMIEGKIPSRGATSKGISPKFVNFGEVEVVGVGDRTVDLPIIRPRTLTLAQMFKLPHDTLQPNCVTDRDARVTFQPRKRKSTQIVGREVITQALKSRRQKKKRDRQRNIKSSPR